VLDALGIEYVVHHPIDRYVADIYIPSYNQVIECDGEYWHSRPGVKERDARRDAELVALGYCVVRVPGRAIVKDARAALEAAWRT